LIEEGFIAYSSGQAVVPTVGELLFENPPGETHIKYGYIKQQTYYVVKIASGFYENAKLGLKSSQGLMLLFSQQTGALLCVLLDEGHLTDIRTVIASMITLKYLAPAKVDCVGIIGTGTQAKLQLEYLDQVCDCKNVMVWGRNQESAIAFQKHFQNSDFNIKITSSLSELATTCNVIITTTPSRESLLDFSQIKKGTHITALGSDTSDKIELAPSIIKNADIVVSDSIPQSQSRGEVFQARNNQCLDVTKLIELGTLIQNPKLGRKNDQQITVADLTGVAVQDIMIATAVFDHHKFLTK
jgi:ornithine cyclodeaminase